MCGIWFYFDNFFKKSDCNVDQGLLYSNFLKIQHRGPDNSTFIKISHSLGNLYFGFHRLKINDQSLEGDQPFVYENNGRTIYTICNGEIYNHRELREKYNFVTRSRSDCEIIPHLYKKLGIVETAKKLVGEFSIVLVDYSDVDIKVFFIRDHFGKRGMFYSFDQDHISCGSELKSICSITDSLKKSKESQGKIGPAHVDPGTISSFEIFLAEFPFRENILYSQTRYYFLNGDYNLDTIDSHKDELDNSNPDTIEKYKNLVRTTLENCVEMMVESDRPIGALLSGGLDSSLIVSILSRHLKNRGKKLHTFSIGSNGSTDEYYARLVANHCDTIHTHFQVDNQECLECVENIIYTTESFDITTNRASVWQYLLAKKIKETTDIKVLFVGDGSDELTGGYLYFHNAPSATDVQNETCRLLKEIHYFDGLRADRGIAAHGLEVRVPFLNHLFVDMYVSLPSELKVVTDTRMEKWLLRESFNNNYLPDQVLWRRKEAFSDGVSSNDTSWYKLVENHFNNNEYSCLLFNRIYISESITHCIPTTRESMYYRYKFKELFGDCDTESIVPHFWLPRWSGNITDPSARELSHY